MTKYPALQAVSVILRVLGWIGAVVSGMILVIGLFSLVAAPTDNDGSMGGNALTGSLSLLAVAGAFSCLAVSFMLVVFGEVIKVFVDIERNTCEAAQLLRSYQLKFHNRDDKTSALAANEVLPKVDEASGNSVFEATEGASEDAPLDWHSEEKAPPIGFQRLRRRAEVGDSIFHIRHGLGTVTGPGRSYFFVRVRFGKGGRETEVDRTSLYQKGT